MKFLTVFYDGECNLCAATRRWLEKQPKYIELRFLAYQSEEARITCPSLDTFDPGKEIVVMSDAGEIYQGGRAWIMCLYALRNYREWSQRLADPALLPLAGKFCRLVSRNRLALSHVFPKHPETVAATLAKEDDPVECPLPKWAQPDLNPPKRY